MGVRVGLALSTHEVNADGRDVRLGVGVIGKTQKQTRLSDTGVSDKEEFEEVVVSVHVGVSTAFCRVGL